MENLIDFFIVDEGSGKSDENQMRETKTINTNNIAFPAILINKLQANDKRVDTHPKKNNVATIADP